MNRYSYKKLLLAAAVGLTILPAQAQYLRTTYFMDNVGSSLLMNPATQPDRGYVYFPVLGSLNVGLTTNGIGVKDGLDCFDTGEDFYNNDELFSRLKDVNKLSASVGFDLISFGFYKGKGFWTFNIGQRMDIDITAPKSMFEFVRDAHDLNDASDILNVGSLPEVRDERVMLNNYTEIAVGHSRAINEKLTVGAKVKALLGGANAEAYVERISVKVNREQQSATIESVGSFTGSMSGLEVTEEHYQDGDSYIDGVELDSYGIAGYGAGIDLGATYKLNNRLTLSASLLDLGFIAWGKEHSINAISDNRKTYDLTGNGVYEFTDRVSNGDIVDFPLFGLKKNVEKKGRTTSLPTTLTVGAEYEVIKNRFSVGALFTNRWGMLHTLTELTLSANYRPNRMFALSGSYSVIQSGGKTFGAAIKLGPLFVGTDYLFLGENTKSVNAMVGLSFGIGKSRKNAMKENN